MKSIEEADEAAFEMALYMALQINETCLLCEAPYIKRSVYDVVGTCCEPYFYDCQEPLKYQPRVETYLNRQQKEKAKQ